MKIYNFFSCDHPVDGPHNNDCSAVVRNINLCFLKNVKWNLFYARQFCIFINNTQFQGKNMMVIIFMWWPHVCFICIATYSQQKTCLTANNMAIKLLLILLFVWFYFKFCYCYVFKHEPFSQLTMGRDFFVQMWLCVPELINDALAAIGRVL